MKNLILTILFTFLTSSFAFASNPSVNWNRMPVQPDSKQYENKEYETTDEYMQALKEGRCSTVWLWMHMPRETKIQLVDELKKQFKEKSNAIIKKPSEFYVREIDEVITSDPNAVNYKLTIIFRTIAVMEYDFDEGIDKEESAKNWLGEPCYQFFKESQK